MRAKSPQLIRTLTNPFEEKKGGDEKITQSMLKCEHLLIGVHSIFAAEWIEWSAFDWIFLSENKTEVNINFLVKRLNIITLMLLNANCASVAYCTRFWCVSIRLSDGGFQTRRKKNGKRKEIPKTNNVGKEAAIVVGRIKAQHNQIQSS